MKDWKEIAKKIFPKEFEEFTKISGRNPVTKFSTIEKDVDRRDIPWNALFYDLGNRKIVDLVGGIEDLNNKVSRFVGDPDMRIKEDPLRILRILRFTSRYNFEMTKESTDAIERNKEQLKIIVRNRIWDEFYKAQVKNFDVYLKYIDQFDLWEYVFPGMKINHNIVNCTSLEVYLGNLFSDEVVDDFNYFNDRLIQECFIPNEISRVSTFLIWFKDFTPEKVTEYYTKKNSYRIDNKTISEFISIIGLTGNEFKAFTKYIPTTSAQELMKQGLKGKALGDKIKEIEIEKFKKLL